MTFITPWLLTGCLFAIIPVILHLLLRQRPQKLNFPALRFLKTRRESNRKTLQWRHWLLLASRILMIAFLAILLARPSIQQTIGSSRNGPVAAALVFDTSIHMNYQFDNQTILEKARKEGLWTLSQLPSGSELAILDSQSSTNAFSVDRSAAKYRIEQLKSGPKAQTLGASISAAAKLLGQSTLPGRELYIFTDLAKSGWDQQAAASVVNSVKSEKNIAVYLIDVGAKEIVNDSLRQLSLKRERLAPGEDLVLDIELSRGFPANVPVTQRNLELYVMNQDGTTEKRGERLLLSDRQEDPLAAAQTADAAKGAPTELTARSSEEVKSEEVKPNAANDQTASAPGGNQTDGNPTDGSNSDGSNTEPFRFTASGFEPGAYQGWVQLSGSDGLKEDDVQFFSFEVSSPQRVLLIVPDAEQKSAAFLRQALAPSLLKQANRNRFTCELANQSDWDSDLMNLNRMNEYDVILALDPNPISTEGWKKLTTWVKSGKGLGIFLGVHATPLDSFNSSEAQQALPGKLQLQARAPEGGNWIWPRSFSHPILKPFAQNQGSVPWNSCPVYRYWQFAEFWPDVNTILRLNDLRPILLERSLGRGTVLTFTTPIGEPPVVASSDKSWNALASSESWPIFILVNQMAEYLGQTQQNRLNYLASESAAILIPENAPDHFQFRQEFRNEHSKSAKPSVSMDLKTNIQGNRSLLVVPAPEKAGNFWLGTEAAIDRIQSGNGSILGNASSTHEPAPVWSLSYNYSGAETDLRRLSNEELDRYWAGYPYSLNKDRSQMERNLAGGRIGQELFPFLAILLIVSMVLETYLSCRFYKKATSN